jgi:7,8-dihydropterin-6-yl-methyl-4-(beta-D-ribofuranosyl)aminobenzene 5'-phosphate synthase
VLFDTGPEAKSFERNILSLRIHLPSIERIVLSHWHRDHSGAIVKALEMAEEQRKAVPSAPNRKIIVDLHKDRPIMRGIAPGPKFEKVIARLPEDPTLEEIEKAGGVVELHEGQTGHVAANGTVYVSGEVPRVLEWEQGLKGGMRWFEDEKGVGTWVTEEVCISFLFDIVQLILT